MEKAVYNLRQTLNQMHFTKIPFPMVATFQEWLNQMTGHFSSPETVKIIFKFWILEF